jgi:ribosomal protein S18 acetylase RimI-like enzyme
LEKPRTTKEHLKILENSSHVVLAIETDNGRVVGFVTAISDILQSALIPFLEVLPQYRKQRIGTALVSRMLRKLKGRPATNLMCDAPPQKYYS